MKNLKYILLAIIAVPLFIFAAQTAMALATCAFTGFLILSGLEELGAINMDEDENVTFILSAVLGVFFFLIYYAVF
jgi:CDP-diglyceride synthetase